MNAFFILLEQIKLFAIYILLGVLLVKTGVLNANTLEPFSRFVIKMALPLLIFTNTVNGVSKQQLYNAAPIILCAVFGYAMLYFLSFLMLRIFHLQEEKKNLYRALGMFGNIGFMGIPILTSLFPENGIVYIGIVTIIDQFLLWTVGVRFTSGTCSGNKDFAWEKMLNPAVIAIITAVMVVSMGWKLPDFINKSLTTVGITATSLALIYLGGVFACMDIWKYLGRFEFYGMALIKMIIFPICFFYLLGFFTLNRELRMTMALLTAMPSMSSLVMMANEDRERGDYIAAGVFITTLLSLATLPAVCWIIQ